MFLELDSLGKNDCGGSERMKRGKFEPREVFNDRLTNNEQKVLNASSVPLENGKFPNGFEIAQKTGLTYYTVVRHLATLEKWMQEE